MTPTVVGVDQETLAVVGESQETYWSRYVRRDTLSGQGKLEETLIVLRVSQERHL